MSELPGGSAKRGRGRPSAGAREAILAAALDVIATDGLAKLTTKHVARRAGVSEASVFYHYRDKLGLLQEVVLAGLDPLRDLDADLAGGRTGQQAAGETLLRIGGALEAFWDRVLPLVEAIMSDPVLRAEFAGRLAEQDLGPHRGVRFVAAHLTELASRGEIRSDVDTAQAALLLAGACFFRAWQRHALSTDEGVPGLAATMAALAQLLAPT